MRRTIWFVLFALICSMAFAQQIKKVPAKYTDPSSGAEMYKAYCASCHGLDAKGNGPAASALKAKMPDMTLLAKSHGGKFPAEHVSHVIIGEATVTAHGSKDMPVWGRAFMTIDHADRSPRHDPERSQRMRRSGVHRKHDGIMNTREGLDDSGETIPVVGVVRAMERQKHVTPGG